LALFLEEYNTLSIPKSASTTLERHPAIGALFTFSTIPQANNKVLGEVKAKIRQ
jgi:hypothetical protein